MLLCGSCVANLYINKNEMDKFIIKTENQPHINMIYPFNSSIKAHNCVAPIKSSQIPKKISPKSLFLSPLDIRRLPNEIRKIVVKEYRRTIKPPANYKLGKIAK